MPGCRPRSGQTDDRCLTGYGDHLIFQQPVDAPGTRRPDNLTPDPPLPRLFDPPLVIVPTMHRSKWIECTLARRCGEFMNVDFKSVETGLWQMVRHPLPDGGLRRPRQSQPLCAADQLARLAGTGKRFQPAVRAGWCCPAQSRGPIIRTVDKPPTNFYDADIIHDSRGGRS